MCKFAIVFLLFFSILVKYNLISMSLCAKKKRIKTMMPILLFYLYDFYFCFNLESEYFLLHLTILKATTIHIVMLVFLCFVDWIFLENMPISLIFYVLKIHLHRCIESFFSSIYVRGWLIFGPLHRNSFITGR